MEAEEILSSSSDGVRDLSDLCPVCGSLQQSLKDLGYSSLVWESPLSSRYSSRLVSLFPEYSRPTGSSVAGDSAQGMVALEELKSTACSQKRDICHKRLKEQVCGLV